MAYRDTMSPEKKLQVRRQLSLSLSILACLINMLNLFFFLLALYWDSVDYGQYPLPRISRVYIGVLSLLFVLAMTTTGIFLIRRMNVVFYEVPKKLLVWVMLASGGFLYKGVSSIILYVSHSVYHTLDDDRVRATVVVLDSTFSELLPAFIVLFATHSLSKLKLRDSSMNWESFGSSLVI